MTAMKAIGYRNYGLPEVLHVCELDKPIPRADEILVEIHAAEATKADCELRSFQFAVKWFWLPLRLAMGIRRPRRPLLGGYFAGKVVQVGEQVERFQVGDEVFGSAGLRMGAYGEYACYPASYSIAAKPTNLSFEQAAAVPLGAFNALHFMRKAKIQPGARVLVNGAGGSIGSFAVQIAKGMGAEVTAVDIGIKEEMLRSIGADHFFDYTKEDFSSAGRTYDVVFDMVAGSSYSKCIGVLNSKGRYLMGNPRVSGMIRSLFTGWLTQKSVHFAFAGETLQELLDLKQMLEAGEIRPLLDRVYPPSQAAQAHRRVEAEERLGIVVLNMRQFSTP